MNLPDTGFRDHLTVFRGSYRARNRVANGLLDAAPLADVILLVFLFFLLSASYAVQPGIRVHLPQASRVEGIPYSPLVVTISQEGLVFFNEERTTLDGLEDAFRRMAYEHPNDTLLVEADEGVKHHILVEVYNKALKAGINDVGLAAQLPGAPVPPPAVP